MNFGGRADETAASEIIAEALESGVNFIDTAPPPQPLESWGGKGCTVGDMHITSDQLVEVLRSQGLRITTARRAVCSVVADHHDEHLTAAKILENVDSDTKVDQSTVYRTLDALEESGLLVHSHLGHGPAVYHLAAEAAHQHIVCSRCGFTSAIPASSLDSWIESLRETTGFAVDPTHFAVTGLCEDCAAQSD